MCSAPARSTRSSARRAFKKCIRPVSETAPLLTVERLSAGYGRSQVLFDVDLNAPPTGIIAILGRNGAGKTTLLKTLAGEIRPMAGSIRFDDEATERQPTEQRVRRGIGYVPQEDAVFGSLTVRENLALGASRRRH